MSEYGVEENVYHSRSIDGNHCMKLGEKGTPTIQSAAPSIWEHTGGESEERYHPGVFGGAS